MEGYEGAVRQSRGAAWRLFALCGCMAALLGAAPPDRGPLVVLGWNDLGMHCMNADFAEVMILPPFNTLHAQVILRGEEPKLVTSGVVVRYVIPSSTHAADRSNFWKYPQPLLGPAPAPNVGLAGARLAGTLGSTANKDWEVVGIPVTPVDDFGRENPYPLATFSVLQNNVVQARTQTVVPVSTEMSCQLCHNEAGISTAADFLGDHDRLHGTNLMSMRPVLCAQCHASNALGLPGQPGVPNLSSAVHTAHAPRMGPVGHLSEVCYACHPGVRTACQRDVHSQNNVTCTDCHGGMLAVGNPARVPWAEEPRCGSCHEREEFEFEQPGVLFRNSVGHGGVHCTACHGSPHAVTPTMTETDNVQANLLQGYPGVINTCTLCHTTPPGTFEHKYDLKLMEGR